MFNGNRYLTLDEMTVNAQYILDYLSALGWSKNAICGMLGNMQSESTINPSIWEGLNSGNLSGGYGLVQWTPATKYLDWCTARGYDNTTLDSALKRILEEVATDTQWGANLQLGSPPYDFKTFTTSTETPYTLAMNFLHFYERPQVNDQPHRGTQAEYWYTTLTGGGTGGGGTYYPRKKGNLLLMIGRNKRRKVIR